MDIRELTTEDEAKEAVTLVIAAHACQFAWPDQNPDHIPSIGPELIRRGARIFAGWADGWRGIMAGMIASDLHSGVLTGFGLMFIVLPGSGAMADALFSRFELECRKAGCKRLTLGMLLGATKSDDNVRKLYSWLGLEPVSESYSKKL